MNIPLRVNLLVALLFMSPLDYSDCENEECGLDNDKAKDCRKQVVQIEVSRVGDLCSTSKDLCIVVIAANFAAETGCRFK